MASTDIQTLLRFLTGPAKLPLRDAIGKARPLLAESLNSPEAIAKAPITQIQQIFSDEKIAKQVQSAAKRASNSSSSIGSKGSKKRSATAVDAKDAGDTFSTSPSKRRKPGRGSQIPEIDPSDAATWELGLDLPIPNRDENVMKEASLTTNRAPLLLAFAIVSLRYTHPWLPMSSRFSLAQGLLEATASVKAKSIGIVREGEGIEEIEEGYKKIRVLGVEIPILRRWDATAPTPDTSMNETETNRDELKQGVGNHRNDVKVLTPDRMNPGGSASTIGTISFVGENAPNDSLSMTEGASASHQVTEHTKTSNSIMFVSSDHPEEPIFWALSPKLLAQPPTSSKQNPAALPIQLPQAAHSYLVRSFSAEMLPLLLGALTIVYESWNDSLDPAELDRRGWSWYCRVRPSVQDGPGGWGGKGVINLTDILKLRKTN